MKQQFKKCQSCEKEDWTEEVEILGKKFYLCEECAIGSIPNSSDQELNRKIIKDCREFVKRMTCGQKGV